MTGSLFNNNMRRGLPPLQSVEKFDVKAVPFLSAAKAQSGWVKVRTPCCPKRPKYGEWKHPLGLADSYPGDEKS